MAPRPSSTSSWGRAGPSWPPAFPAEGDWEVARQIRLFADSLRMHLFDPETTRKIAR
ncbi:hypothetical protein CSE45_1161 [Citreicella sp. SE45]|nr:hypothetical protein CSE45_1161 [Citreicella sp. SE45]